MKWNMLNVACSDCGSVSGIEVSQVAWYRLYADEAMETEGSQRASLRPDRDSRAYCLDCEWAGRFDDLSDRLDTKIRSRFQLVRTGRAASVCARHAAALNVSWLLEGMSAVRDRDNLNESSCISERVNSRRVISYGACDDC
jgi:hypothetical protein